MSTKLNSFSLTLKGLAREIVKKTVRLRNKASLVASDPVAGRNWTALRNTAAELSTLIDEVLAQRCRVCGCTATDCPGCIEKLGGLCHWVEQDLCSACVE